MGNTVTIYKGEGVEVHEDVLGHQVGNGAVQILLPNGNSRIVFAPDDIDITLDEEGNARFEADLEQKIAEAGRQVDASDQRPVEEQVKAEPTLVAVNETEH